MAAVVSRTNRWPVALAAVLATYAVLTGLLVMAIPVKDGARDWFASLIPGGWMAWSFPTAMFFLTIFTLIALMAVW
ncbi:MAG: glycerol-3-phosphate ABC transporter, partial [Proteobacteria bacterium]|nr:glycerol-3-phosphate ABC transporter [Pseudomonadota bacterium]